jgi:hypothetical protein
MVSSGGAVRKVPAVNDNNTPPSNTNIYTLNQSILPDKGGTGGNLGNQGSPLVWMKDGVTSQYITLPMDGAYMFSFFLNGAITNNLGMGANQAVGNTYYFSVFEYGKNYDTRISPSLTNSPLDIQEIVITVPGGSNQAYSYTANLTLKGTAGMRVWFKMAAYVNQPWTLTGITGTDGKTVNDPSVRTSMTFWRL